MTQRHDDGGTDAYYYIFVVDPRHGTEKERQRRSSRRRRPYAPSYNIVTTPPRTNATVVIVYTLSKHNKTLYTGHVIEIVYHSTVTINNNRYYTYVYDYTAKSPLTDTSQQSVYLLITDVVKYIVDECS